MIAVTAPFGVRRFPVSLNVNAFARLPFNAFYVRRMINFLRTVICEATVDQQEQSIRERIIPRVIRRVIIQRLKNY